MNNLIEKTLTIIGAGNIGQILLRRLLENNYPKGQLIICDNDPDKEKAIASQFGVNAAPLSNESIWGADLFLVTTPPNVVLDIVETLAPNLRSEQIIISFAAAISIEWLEELVPEGVAVARVMPNAPSLVGQGCNPVAYGSRITTKNKALIEELLALLGESLSVPDGLMNWCVGLTGAAMRSLLPAIEGMTEAGLEAGLNASDARQIAAQIMLGAATLVQQTELSFEQIKALTPMQTVEETELAQIFQDAARQAQEKIENYQKKLAPGN